ncbi:MAG: hypothetical protein ACPMAG_07770 [Limisphaerales bacterium]
MKNPIGILGVLICLGQLIAHSQINTFPYQSPTSSKATLSFSELPVGRTFYFSNDPQRQYRWLKETDSRAHNLKNDCIAYIAPDIQVIPEVFFTAAPASASLNYNYQNPAINTKPAIGQSIDSKYIQTISPATDAITTPLNQTSRQRKSLFQNEFNALDEGVSRSFQNFGVFKHHEISFNNGYTIHGMENRLGNNTFYDLQDNRGNSVNITRSKLGGLTFDDYRFRDGIKGTGIGSRLNMFKFYDYSDNLGNRMEIIGTRLGGVELYDIKVNNGVRKTFTSWDFIK